MRYFGTMMLPLRGLQVFVHHLVVLSAASALFSPMREVVGLMMTLLMPKVVLKPARLSVRCVLGVTKVMMPR